MSDPKQNAALTSRDVTHIVEAAGTHSLISASVLSSRVITEATAYFERSASALEKILATLEGKGAGGASKPLAVTAALDQASAKSISDTLAGTIQPQLDKHGETLAELLARLAELAQAAAESERLIASVLLGEEGHIGRLERDIGENRHLVASILLGEEGHIERLGLEVAALAARLTQLEERQEKPEAPPRGGVAGSSFSQEAREMREAQEVLRERVGTVEASIRQMLARTPDQGGPRPPRRR
jgi:hypothetical protein